MLLPEKIAEAEVDIRFRRSGLCGGSKFGYGFTGATVAVESFAGEHVDLPRHKNAGRAIGLPAKKD